jgi:hypothetical protein
MTGGWMPTSDAAIEAAGSRWIQRLRERKERATDPAEDFWFAQGANMGVIQEK